MIRVVGRDRRTERSTERRAVAPDLPSHWLLRLRRTAGNQAVIRSLRSRRVLARRVTADVLAQDVGEGFADELTAEELRHQAAILVSALEFGQPEPAKRMMMEQNLEFLESYAAAHHAALPSATAHEFRRALAVHAKDVGNQIQAVKRVVPTESGFESGAFRKQLEWHVDQLETVGKNTVRAIELVKQAEAGGDASAQRFADAGTNLSAAMLGLKAEAIVLAFDNFAYEVGKDYPHVTAEPRKYAELAHRVIGPALARLNQPQPDDVDAIADVLIEAPGQQPGEEWQWRFSNMVDETQDDIEAHARFVGWLNVAMLAWLAFDIWTLPAAGGPGGGGGTPRIGGFGGGAGGAAGATATTALASAEALRALQQLVAIGALTAPKFARFVGGRAGGVRAPQKPMQTSTSGGQPGAGRARQLPSGKTGEITSDVDLRSAKDARRGGRPTKTVYELKKASKLAADQAEVRMAELFKREGRKVHFNAHDQAGDLTIDDVKADVKLLTQKRSITSAVTRGAGQAPDVIIDGTQVGLTRADTERMIRELQDEIAKHPGKYRNLKTIYIVEGSAENPTIYIHHRQGAPLRVPAPHTPTIRTAGHGG